MSEREVLSLQAMATGDETAPAVIALSCSSCGATSCF
jgi:hypothetical protein